MEDGPSLSVFKINLKTSKIKKVERTKYVVSIDSTVLHIHELVLNVNKYIQGVPHQIRSLIAQDCDFKD